MSVLISRFRRPCPATLTLFLLLLLFLESTTQILLIRYNIFKLRTVGRLCSRISQFERQIRTLTKNTLHLTVLLKLIWGSGTPAAQTVKSGYSKKRTLINWSRVEYLLAAVVRSNPKEAAFCFRITR